MSTVVNVFLAIIFVVLAFGATVLMYHLWGYPFDHKTNRSAAPRWAMALHRVMGWMFVAIYIYLMMQMVPRMWSYQIELPARTVLHMTLGYSIGALLLAKVLVVRFFKHLEAKLAPALGTTVFIMTLVLMGLALPTVWRENVLANQAMGGDGFSEERIKRVREQLPQIGVEDEALLTELSSARGLLMGRELMRTKCVQCHDLRTILARPRTPKNWRDTVNRMADRASIVSGFNETERWQITAYLVAITPTLQSSIMAQRKLNTRSASAAAAATAARQSSTPMPDNYDMEAAEQMFNARCSQCHSAELAKVRTFGSVEEISSLIGRMVANGLEADANELEQITRYLAEFHEVSTDDALDTASASVPVSMPELATVSGCTGCHAIDSQIVGPAWTDVAARYRDDPDARERLIVAVRDGGSGNWSDQTGGVPMPPMLGGATEEAISELVDFILQLDRR